MFLQYVMIYSVVQLYCHVFPQSWAPPCSTQPRCGEDGVGTQNIYPKKRRCYLRTVDSSHPSQIPTFFTSRRFPLSLSLSFYVYIYIHIQSYTHDTTYYTICTIYYNLWILKRSSCAAFTKGRGKRLIRTMPLFGLVSPKRIKGLDVMMWSAAGISFKKMRSSLDLRSK